MAAILAILLGLAVGGLIWTADRANDIALDRQSAQIRAALQNLGRDILRDLAGISEEAFSAAGRGRSEPEHSTLIQAAERRGFSVIALLRGGEIIALGRGKGAPAGPAGEAETALLQTVLAKARGAAMLAASRSDRFGADLDQPARTGAVELTAGPEGPFFTAAITLPRVGDDADGGVFQVAATRPLDQELISRLGAASGAGDLRYTARPEGREMAHIPVVEQSGTGAGALVWTPDRPRDRVMERVAPAVLVALAGIALFSALMFRHVRRVTTELVRREAQATHLAHHDPLSGLPNRALFAQRLDHELERLDRGGDALAVLYLDLDRFKEINDTHGHEGGDTVIRVVARRLSDLLRGADSLGRFGGDEFAVIQTGVREPRDSEALARRILDSVCQPIPLSEGEAFVGVSIGIALAPQNGGTREDLMRLADVALYRAKHEGRNRYCFFETQMDEMLKLRKIVEDDLRAAIESDQLELRYQPQVSVDGRDIVGVEALVRWNHPRRGPIPPADFVPIAEERGLIAPLGEWVLRRAMRDARRWPKISVAVNVSPIQFRHKDFTASVARIVEDAGIDPARLELELTEGVIVDDADLAEQAMIELRSLGVRMALDDFGTGYSSLIYLRRFAFDKIKIDRSFLEAMEATGESAILVHSVVHLGRALGLTVTAEGVETEEQRLFLMAAGCHQLQGYLFSEPVTAEHVERLLAATEKRHDGEAA